MPSIKMKTNLSTSVVKEKNCLSVCQKSSMISKKSCSDDAVCRHVSELKECFHECQDGYGKQLQLENADVPVSLRVEHIPNTESSKAVDQQELSDEGSNQILKLPVPSTDISDFERMEFSHNRTSNLETIFSPALEHVDVDSVPNIDDNDAGSNNDLNVPKIGTDGSSGTRSSPDYQTCNVSDFFISDMIMAGLPVGEDIADDDINKSDSFLDYKCAETNMLFDLDDDCMILPFLEDTAKMTYSNGMKSHEEPTMGTDNESFYLAISQIRSYDQDSDIKSNSDQAEEFDPQFFIKNVPELSDVVSDLRSTIFPKESQRTKSITLVLDLDETLVHSTLEHCDDADFTFNVFFDMKDHTVYVKQRPHLHTFLERVAEMFEVVIFTASQSIYAEKLLDRLDPDGKIISRRVYRESCIFSDGTYTKDLTVLGVDLAKIAIIDNTPQVFRLQVNNGIPIKSWFSDPSDCALMSLLPFLETLAEADDVRPIIAKRFGNKE